MTSRKIALCLGLMVSSASVHAQQQQQRQQQQCGQHQYVPFNKYRVGVFSRCVDQIDSLEWNCLLHLNGYCQGNSDGIAIADKFSACLKAFDLEIGNTKHPFAVSSGVILEDLRNLDTWGMTYFSKESVAFGLAILRAQASPGDKKWAVVIDCNLKGPDWVSIYQSSL